MHSGTRLHASGGNHLRRLPARHHYADYDLEPANRSYYRVAFLDAFRRYGIFPRDVGTLSVETLLWPAPASQAEVASLSAFVAELSREQTYWRLPRDRESQWQILEDGKRRLHDHLSLGAKSGAGRVGGIDFKKPFEVVTFQLRERPDASSVGTRSAQWIVKIVQPPGATTFETGTQSRKVAGCTLVVDADSGRVRYHIQRATGGKRAKHERPNDLLARAGTATAVPPPVERKLRVFAFDPSLGVKLETSGINEVVLSIPWERDAAGADLLKKGPVGEYVEVIDRDPSSGCFYSPVDLNHPHVLAQEGLAPSATRCSTSRWFAVAMRGSAISRQRSGGWRSGLPPSRCGLTTTLEWQDDEYVPRLLYPHALREANVSARQRQCYSAISAPVAADTGRARG